MTSRWEKTQIMEIKLEEMETKIKKVERIMHRSN
jgi:hypothetical protein